LTLSLIKGKLLVHAVSEHVENAGVHSGDATLVLPPFSLDKNDMARLKGIAEKVAVALPFRVRSICKSFGSQSITPARMPRSRL
jgi:carbamoyl-phosphate synthase large subunit